MMRLFGVHPAPCQQKLHGDVIGNPLRQFDGSRVRDRARANFGKRESRVSRRQNNIARKRQFQTAAATYPVHGADDRLVHGAQFLQTAEAADSVIAVHRIAFFAAGGGRRLQIPAGAEKFLVLRGQNRDPKLRIVSERLKNLSHQATRLKIDRIGFGAVQNDLQNRAFALCFYRCVSHALSF